MADLHALRNALRQQRTGLSALEQLQHAEQLRQHFAEHALFADAQRIGFYLAVNGEADPGLLLKQALTRKTHCYLPRLQDEHMQFHAFAETDALLANRYGIPEPAAASPAIATQDLDLILLPLVAFDDRGTRLGMGGGFYDRTLAFCLQEARPKPHLVGVAYGFQEVERLERQVWDVPLEGVITEAGYRAF